jgi:hypothetical protein
MSSPRRRMRLHDMPINRRPLLLLIAASLCAAGSLFLWSLYFTLYWPHRGRFNEQGRYLDEATSTVFHEQSGVLAIPALVLSLFAVFLALLWWRLRPGRAGPPA